MQQEHLNKERQARDKALALLRTRLGKQEWRLFERTNTLTVPSRLWPGVFYLLRINEAIKVVRDGRVTASLCVLTTGGEPWPDRLMTILDLIESDERRLWQMANVGGGNPSSVMRNRFKDAWSYFVVAVCLGGVLLLLMWATWLFLP